MRKPLFFQLVLVLFPVTYTLAQNSCATGTILISEIYSDPSPSNGLPDYEFLELLNASVDTLNVDGWKLTDGAVSTMINAGAVTPGERLILCPSSGASFYSVYGKTRGLSPWPTLNNSSDSVTLLDNKGLVVDWVKYDMDELSGSGKTTGGWSMEIIDPCLKCRGFENWNFSVHPEGGTPGSINSVYQNMPDTVPPNLVEAVALSPGAVALFFDEPMDTISLRGSAFVVGNEEVARFKINTNDSRQVIVYLAGQLEADLIYNVAVSGARDCNGNSLLKNTATFTFNTAPPHITGVHYISFTSLRICFDESLEKTSAENPDHFSVEGFITQEAVLIRPDVVELHFDRKFDFQPYILETRNLSDRSGNISVDERLAFDFYTELDSIVIHDPLLLELQFSKEPAYRDLRNFHVDPGGQPEKISMADGSKRNLLLLLSSPLKSNSSSVIAMDSLFDQSGEWMQTPVQAFFYDTKPPQLHQLIVLDSLRLLAVFSEKIDLATAVAIHNFKVDGKIGLPERIEPQNDSTLLLLFGNPFGNEITNKLTIDNISDASHNILQRAITVSFTFDRTPPQLAALTPAAGIGLKLDFNENIAAGWASKENFSLNLGFGHPDSVAICPFDPSILILYFSQQLKESADYTLEIQPLEDQLGNRHERSFTRSFSTISPAIAEITAISGNEARIDFTEEIDFLQALDPANYMLNGNERAVAVRADGSSRLICRFQNDFRTDTLNHIAIAVITDRYGNSVEHDSAGFIYKKFISKASALEYSLIQIEFINALESASVASASFTFSTGATVRFALTSPGEPSVLKIMTDQRFEENQVVEIEIAGLRDASGRSLPREKVWFVLDLTPPRITCISTFLPQTIEAVFSEELDEKSARNVLFYRVAGLGYALTADWDKETKNRIFLTFENNLSEGVEYKLLVSGIMDKSGNAMINQEVAFAYLPPSDPQFNDLIITEIMASPGDHFPSEYLELYNRSGDTIQLSGLTVSDPASTSTLGRLSLPPSNYVILAPQAEAGFYAGAGPTLSISNWPSLNDAGDELMLRNRAGEVIFSVVYQDSWYKDPLKKKGWSLEMIDVNNPCTGYHNWTASNATERGTPGKSNSATLENPDLTSPRLVKADAPNNRLISLKFSEKIDPASITRPDFIVLEPHVGLNSPDWINGSSENLEIVTKEAMEVKKTYHVLLGDARDCVGNPVLKEDQLSFQVCQPASPNDIQINEVLFNPRPGGVEFIEIYNNSPHPVDLRKWRILSGKEEGSFSTSLVIDSGDYQAITTDPAILESQYPNGRRDKFYAMPGLPNLPAGEGIILLKDSSGALIDSAAYNQNMHMSLIEDDHGISLERMSHDLSSTEASNWKSASGTSGYATPGYRNSQQKPDSEKGGRFSVDPLSFSPGDPMGRGHVFILYQLDGPGFVGNATIFDRAGRLVKQIASNESLGIEGSFRWDGDDNTGKFVGAGYYIIFMEAFDLNGKVIRFKGKVAVAPGS